MRLLIYWIISAISLIVSAYFARLVGFDIDVDTGNPLMLMLGVAVLGFVNATIGTLLKLATLPLACLTFGLVWVLINALMFYWVGQWGIGFHVGDFWAALVGSLLMSLVLGLLRGLFDKNENSAKA